MKETINQLIALQQIDLTIDTIDQEINTEQEKLDMRNAALVQREADLQELTEKINDLERERRTLEMEVADEMAHVRDRQGKMMQVQTGREQTALLKEIEDGKKGAKEKEEKIVAIMEEVEALNSRIVEEKNLIKGEQELLGEETVKVRAAIEKIGKGKVSKLSERKRQADEMDGKLLKKYEMLRARRKGLAVVNVLQGVCQGCFMAIPPQKFNTLLKGDIFFDCPTCQRIMYHRPIDE